MPPPGSAGRPTGGNRRAAKATSGTCYGPEHNSLERAPQALRGDVSFRHLVRRLHRLGERPLGELLAEVAAAHPIEADVYRRLEVYGRLDPAVVAQLDARSWSRMPLAVVR